MGIQTPRPEYLQVAAALRNAIKGGEWAPGALMPSEPELAARYGVTRATVNRAVSVLRAEGLVRPERGRGTTVNELPVIRREAAARQRRETREAGQARGAFDGELRRLGLTARSDVEVAQVPAPAAVAELLGVDEGTTVLARRRRMYANDTPVPLDIAAGTALADSDPGPGGTYSRLADLGHAPATYAETARVRPPDDDETRFLHMDPDQRVVAIRRTARTTSGRIVEVNEITLPAHQWELVYEWPAE
ncbi:MAG: GntR family transcriptional regulator [Streptosporangiaceae bacterium]